MEAYFLFHSGRAAAPEAAEQEEDIGSPSDSESPTTSRDSAGSSSSELDDDASSSSGSDPDRFEMSALMTQLPFKRGLSRFFDGKSQSFASLAAVGSLEDLPKPARKRLKPSRSCGGALDAHRGRLLSPRRHCAKPASGARKAAAAARSGALSVLAAVAPRMPPPPVARPRIGLPELNVDAHDTHAFDGVRCRSLAGTATHRRIPHLPQLTAKSMA